MTVVIRAHHADGEAREIARVTYGADGVVTCTNEALLAQWTERGIVGRADRGRLYPKDGAAFMQELPFMYRSPYMQAVLL